VGSNRSDERRPLEHELIVRGHKRGRRS
jgi:hypothetical protein